MADTTHVEITELFGRKTVIEAGHVTIEVDPTKLRDPDTEPGPGYYARIIITGIVSLKNVPVSSE